MLGVLRVRTDQSTAPLCEGAPNLTGRRPLGLVGC